MKLLKRFVDFVNKILRRLTRSEVDKSHNKGAMFITLCLILPTERLTLSKAYKAC